MRLYISQVRTCSILPVIVVLPPEAPLTYPGVDAGRYPTPGTVLVGASVSF